MKSKKVKPNPGKYRQAVLRGWFEYQTTAWYKGVWWGEFAVWMVVLLSHERTPYHVFFAYLAVYVVVAGSTDYVFFRLAKRGH